MAHTTPVYVTVRGGGFHNPKTAPDYLDLCEKYLQELEGELANPSERVDRHAWRYKEGLNARIGETRKIIEKLRIKLK